MLRWALVLMLTFGIVGVSYGQDLRFYDGKLHVGIPCGAGTCYEPVEPFVAREGNDKTKSLLTDILDTLRDIRNMMKPDGFAPLTASKTPYGTMILPICGTDAVKGFPEGFPCFDSENDTIQHEGN